jgi:hypothetical protein
MKKKTVAKPKGKQKVGKGGDFLDNPGPGGSAAGKGAKAKKKKKKG